MNRFINFEGKKSSVSWVAILGFLLMFIILYIIFFSWVESLFGIAILGSMAFVTSLIIFNQGPVEFFLTLKWWSKTSVSTPFKEDQTPRMKDIKPLQLAIKILREKNNEDDF